MIVKNISQATLDLVTRLLWAASLVVGLLMLGLAGRYLVDLRSASALEVERKSLVLQTAKLATPPPANLRADQLPHGLEALRLLQSAVTKGAAENQCQLAEFRSATQTAPYLPRYKKNVPEDPRNQMDAHFTLNGRLRDVVETLRGLGRLPIPIEIDALNFSRGTIAEDGSTTVIAQVDLRAITQGAAS